MKADATETKSGRFRAKLMGGGDTNFVSPQFFPTREAALEHGKPWVAGALKLKSLEGKLTKAKRDLKGTQETLREVGTNNTKVTAENAALKKDVARERARAELAEDRVKTLGDSAAAAVKERDHGLDRVRALKWRLFIMSAVAVTACVAVADLKWEILPW